MLESRVLAALALLTVLFFLAWLLERWMESRSARDGERMFPDLRWRNDE